MNPLQPLLESLSEPRPVYLLVGLDPVLVREAVAAIRDAVVPPAVAAFNDATVNAAEERGGSFVEVARTVPMMAARRLVVLRQVEEAPTAVLEALLAYAQAPVPSTVLVVQGERFPAAREGRDHGARITNAVKKTGMVVEVAAAAADPAGFAVARAQRLGVRLDREAARLLLDYTDGELALIEADVEKCAAFVGEGGAITAAVVEEVCRSTAEAQVWSLTDALVARDRDRALATLHRLLEDGEPAHKLLASVAWQLRQVLALQDAVRRGLPEREANVRMPPQKVRAVRELVQKHPISPSATLEELAAVNRAMNLSRAGDRRVFEAWVARLCGL